MQEKKSAVFSCRGLGDGLISLVLSNNLFRNGHRTTTFHPFLFEMQKWFPHLPLQEFPSEECIEGILSGYDHFFIMYEKSPWMQKVLEYCLKKHPSKTRIINPIATPRKDYLYWEQSQFDGKRPFAENICMFCKNILKLSDATLENGIQRPSSLVFQKARGRVIIHPTSSRPGKNWPQEKFLELANLLKKRGLKPAFILTPEEREGWDLSKIEAPQFANLDELVSYVALSGSMVGNDSGIGHLASCLSLPTLTVCRSRMAANFWRPAWSPGEVVCPSPWIPNLKGLRLRDKYWQSWVSVPKVYASFLRLVG